MKTRISILSGLALVLSICLISCTNKPKSGDEKESLVLEAEREAHVGEKHGGGEGEESGKQLLLDQVYDAERKGTHMVLSYDAESVAFTGTVENISKEVLDRVRVEVHLSNGTELGPTTQVDLAPGEKREVRLSAAGEEFKSWSTHAEVGSGEHSHEGEHRHEGEHNHEGEHSHEGEGEHGHSHEDGGHEHR